MRVRTRAIALAGVLGMVAALAVATPAAAAEGSNCWGVVSSQTARSDGGLGGHSSAQEEPRLGLGNLARALGVNGPGGLGSFLASVDGNDATHC